MPEPNTRDHLANERTFLAWVRTSIALMGFGVVIAKLRFLVAEAGAAHSLSPPAGAHSTTLGLAFVIVGLLTLLFAYLHYDRTRRDIDAGKYGATRGTMLAFVGVIFVLGLASVWYLLSLSVR